MPVIFVIYMFPLTQHLFVLSSQSHQKMVSHQQGLPFLPHLPYLKRITLNYTYKCIQCIPSSILANKPSLMDSGLARAAVTSATSFLLV